MKPSTTVMSDHGAAKLMERVVAVVVDPDLDQIVCFYERAGWRHTLRRFANIDEMKKRLWRRPSHRFGPRVCKLPLLCLRTSMRTLRIAAALR